MRRFRVFVIAALAGAGVLAATPAAAQRMSDGFLFLKAVKDRDGTKATEALQKPGSTIVNARDTSTGESALHIVVQRRDITWLRFLLAKGANPNIADGKNVTPLQLAANFGWVEGVEQLVAKGAAVEAANATGETPLIAAVHRRDLLTVKALLKGGANPDRSDLSGRTASDYAKDYGNDSEIVMALDQARADRNARAAKAYGPGS